MAGALDPEPDRQPVDRAFAQERVDLPGARHREIELSAHPQAPAVFHDGQPAAERRGRVVLEEEAHAADAAARQAVREGARRHHVLAEVGDAEKARVALEDAAFPDGRDRRGQQFRFAGERAGSGARKRMCGHG